MALVSGFVWLSGSVRQLFQGPIWFTGEVNDGELYSYSVVWLLYGAGLLGLGVWKQTKALRYASAAVVLMTVVKVGLLDASGLTGLYRVASFLGLGLALIGLGYFYQQVILKRA